MLPFLVDTISGSTDVYDAFEPWDEVVHFVSGAAVAVAVAQLAAPLRLGRAVQAALGIGWAAVAAILWELAQYATMLHDKPDQGALYPDTLSDLACGLAGAVVGALLGIMLL